MRAGFVPEKHVVSQLLVGTRLAFPRTKRAGAPFSPGSSSAARPASPAAI